VLVASRSKVARSEHYRWLHEDPSYRLRLSPASTSAPASPRRFE
jgi:hypothetical protein